MKPHPNPEHDRLEKLNHELTLYNRELVERVNSLHSRIEQLIKLDTSHKERTQHFRDRLGIVVFHRDSWAMACLVTWTGVFILTLIQIFSR